MTLEEAHENYIVICKALHAEMQRLAGITPKDANEIKNHLLSMRDMVIKMQRIQYGLAEVCGVPKEKLLQWSRDKRIQI